VVTTHDANRTEIYDRLFEVRLEYTDLTIELWNRESLSTLPNSHPEIVTAFFGPAITEVFCPAPIQPPVARTELVGEQPNARRCCAARQPTWALKRNWPQPIRTAKRLPLRRPRPTDVSPSSMRMLREHDEQTTAPLAS
jgi:hypothetical protein